MTPTAPTVTIVAHDIGPIGGMERQLTELVTGLARRGYDVRVIARRLQLPAGTPVTFIRVRAPARPFPLAYPWFLIAGGVVTRRYRRGLVQSTGTIVLGSVDITAIHLCHHAIARLGTAPRSARGGRVGRLNARLSAALSHAGERWLLQPERTRRVIAVSGGVATEVKTHFPAVGALVRTIPNGVDSGRYSPGTPTSKAVQAARIPGAQRVAMFVGSEWSAKGLRLAIKALSYAPEWGLLVVGRGDENSYRAYAQDACVEPRVRFLGPRSDLPDLYRAVDAFVLPSAYETSSLVAHEAAASGVPLIITPVHGISELITDGDSGWIVEPRAEAIGDCLRAVAEHPETAAKMAARARAAVRDRTWPAMVDAHCVLYAELGS